MGRQWWAAIAEYTLLRLGSGPSLSIDRWLTLTKQLWRSSPRSFAAFPGRFRFTSGIRTEAQNAAAGGVSGSYHLTGWAADFVPVNGHFPPGELERIAQIVSRHGYEVIKHNARSGLHYHIEPAPGYQFGQPVSTLGGPSSVSNAMIYAVGFFIVLVLVRD